jgi:sec-independent protein translocase protein TatC
MEIGGLISYLEGIRHRVIGYLLFALAITVVAYIFSEQIIRYLHKPYGGTLAFYRLPEPFFVKIGISISTGLFVAMPYLFFEISYMVTARLASHPRRYALLMAFSACLLYFLGALIAYTVLLPQGIKFLTKFASQSIEPIISIQKYVSFCAIVIFAMALFFEMPLVFLFLCRVGLVDYKTLSSFRRYAILLMAIAAAVFTPTPDAVNMLLMAVPLWLLYEFSILLVRIFAKK